MSSRNFIDAVTHVPADWANSVDALVYDVFGGAVTLNEAKEVLGLQGMAYQPDDEVFISGGTLNRVNIGVTTPAGTVVANFLRVNNAPLSPTDALNLGWFESVIGDLIAAQITSFGGALGDMSEQNASSVNIQGGSLNAVTIGANQPAFGRFSTLKLNNNPTQADDVLTLGWATATYGEILDQIQSMAYQPATAVAILGGNIDNTAIGIVSPAAARFTNAQITGAITAPLHATSKQYVDAQIAAISASFGTMANQNASAVAITGGEIEGTSIGAVTPAIGSFVRVYATGTNPEINLNSMSAAPNTYGLTLTHSFQQKLTLGYSTPASGDAEIADRITLFSSTQFVIRTVGNSVTNAIWGANSEIHKNTGSVRFGNVTSPNVDKINVVGGLTSDSLRATAIAYVGGIYGTTDTHHTFQNAGASRANAHNDRLQNIIASTGSTAVDLSLGSGIRIVLNASTNIGFTSGSTGSTVNISRQLTFYIAQGVTGGFNATFPFNVVWASGSPPSFSGGAAYSVKIVQLFSPDDGVTWYGGVLS